jgi:hypothetical protein
MGCSAICVKVNSAFLLKIIIYSAICQPQSKVDKSLRVRRIAVQSPVKKFQYAPAFFKEFLASAAQHAG